MKTTLMAKILPTLTTVLLAVLGSPFLTALMFGIITKLLLLYFDNELKLVAQWLRFNTPNIMKIDFKQFFWTKQGFKAWPNLFVWIASFAGVCYAIAKITGYY